MVLTSIEDHKNDSYLTHCSPRFYIFMLQIIALNEDDLDKMGVYWIWFGHKYYIGSTVNTLQRIRGHDRNINECMFLNTKRGNNSITKIVDHLNAYPYINNGFFELRYECETELGLVYREQKCLYDSMYDDNCLNFEIEVKRKIDGILYRGRDQIQSGIDYNKNLYEIWKDRSPKPFKPHEWDIILQSVNTVIPPLK